MRQVEVSHDSQEAGDGALDEEQPLPALQSMGAAEGEEAERKRPGQGTCDCVAGPEQGEAEAKFRVGVVAGDVQCHSYKVREECESGRGHVPGIYPPSIAPMKNLKANRPLALFMKIWHHVHTPQRNMVMGSHVSAPIFFVMMLNGISVRMKPNIKRVWAVLI